MSDDVLRHNLSFNMNVLVIHHRTKLNTAYSPNEVVSMIHFRTNIKKSFILYG